MFHHGTIDPFYHHIVWGILGTVHFCASIFTIFLLLLEGVFSSQPISFFLELFPVYGPTYHFSFITYLALNGFMSIADGTVALTARNNHAWYKRGAIIKCWHVLSSFQALSLAVLSCCLCILCYDLNGIYESLQLPHAMTTIYHDSAIFRDRLHVVQSHYSCCGIDSVFDYYNITSIASSGSSSSSSSSSDDSSSSSSSSNSTNNSSLIADNTTSISLELLKLSIHGHVISGGRGSVDVPTSCCANETCVTPADTPNHIPVFDNGCHYRITNHIETYFCWVTLLTLTLAIKKTVIVAVSFVAMPRKSALAKAREKANMIKSGQMINGRRASAFLLFPVKKSVKYDIGSKSSSSASGRGNSLSGGSGVGLRVSSSSSVMSSAGLTYRERLKNLLTFVRGNELD